jgi:integrase
VAEVPAGWSPKTGKPKREYIYGKTRAEVAEKLAKTLSEIHAGTYVAPDKITTGGWLDRWLAGKLKLRRSTRENYDYMITQHLKPVIGNKLLRKIQRPELQKLINDLHEKGHVDGNGGLSPRSVEIAAIILRSSLKRAWLDGLIGRNPAAGLELPEKNAEEVVPFTREEAIAFLNKAKDNRQFAAYYLDLRSGVRRGELLGFQWKDIDRKAMQIRVQRQLLQILQPEGSRTKYALEFAPPKTKKSKGTIPLSHGTLAVLDAHRAAQDKERAFFGDKYQDEDLIFCTPDGRRLWPRNVNRQYRALLKAAKIPYRKLHALRHTCATLLIEDGEELKVVQELLRHTSISTTANIYVHVLDRMKKKADKRFDRILPIEGVTQPAQPARLRLLRKFPDILRNSKRSPKL